MRQQPFTIHHLLLFVLAVICSIGMASIAGAQSQEPKPALPATPVAETDPGALDTPPSGVSGSAWQGPVWGVRVSWDPAIWAAEAEFSDDGYDGLQITTPSSTVYIEAYERFAGDAAACLADATQEISMREGVSEAVPLTGRPLPVPDDMRGEAALLGLTLTLPDGTIVRAVEYVECRTVVPGTVVLELTWQTVTGAFNEDFPNVEALLTAIELPAASPPDATPGASMATPIA